MDESDNITSRKNFGIAAAWKSFVEKTSLVGLSYINSSTNFFTRGLWILIFIGLVAATAWNTAKVVSEYLSYPVETTVTVESKSTVPFPAVTVCNRNPVPCSKLAKAYFKYPEDLGPLMKTSKCTKTVTNLPLLSEV